VIGEGGTGKVWEVEIGREHYALKTPNSDEVLEGDSDETYPGQDKSSADEFVT